MDFTLNEEQEMFKDMARKFFEAECDVSMVRNIEASDSGHMPELWAKMADLGWLGIIIPEEYGGIDLSLLEVAILFEEIVAFVKDAFEFTDDIILLQFSI